MPAILFVCTANICRSPMAAALFRKIVAEREDVAEWRIESAGTWAINGAPAATLAQVVMRERGMDLSTHRSRVVTGEMLYDFNLILVMERGHKEALRFEFPEIARRVYLLSEMAGRPRNIVDPIAGPLEEYRDTVLELESVLTAGLDRIVRLAYGRLSGTGPLLLGSTS